METNKYLFRKELSQVSKERWDVPVVVIQDDGKEYASVASFGIVYVNQDGVEFPVNLG